MQRSGTGRWMGSVLLLALACGDDPTPPAAPPVTAAPEAPTPDPQDNRSEVYARAMDEVADDVIAKTRAAAAADYEDYASAQAALMSVLPQQSLTKIDDVLIDAGISQADMAAFMRDNPEFVQQVGAQFSQRLSEVEPDLAELIAKVAALAPPEQKDSVVAQLEGLGYGHLLDGPTWNDVADAAALADLAERAAKNDKGLLVDVRADWCAPCKQLETETFGNAEVRALLARRFVLARLDVTEPKAGARALQEVLKATTLPAVLAWAKPDAVRSALASPSGSSRVPSPDLDIRVFVAADDFLAAAQGLGGSDVETLSGHSRTGGFHSNDE